MPKTLKIIVGIVLLLLGLYFGLGVVVGMVALAGGEPGAWTFIGLLIPSVCFIVLAVVLFKWARE